MVLITRLSWYFSKQIRLTLKWKAVGDFWLRGVPTKRNKVHGKMSLRYGKIIRCYCRGYCTTISSDGCHQVNLTMSCQGGGRSIPVAKVDYCKAVFIECEGSVYDVSTGFLWRGGKRQTRHYSCVDLAGELSRRCTITSGSDLAHQGKQV
jgi:hypothetical protein